MVNNSDTKVSYKGNGQTTVFPFFFPFIQRDYIKVAIYDSLTDETKTIDSDYYVDTIANAVIYPGYEPGQEPAESLRPPILPATSTITIYRQTDVDQLTDLGEKYPLKDIENMADKLTEIIQEQAETLGRAVKVPVGDHKTPEEKLTDLQNYVSDAANSAKNAATSEASAQRAAEAAATSEANAAESERIAGGYADTATAAAGRAEDSAISARAYNAPDYDNAKTYQAGDVVTYTDGNSYRALQETTGNEPPNIIYWQKVTDYVGDNFFEVDEYGYIVPMDRPSHSRYWRVDQNGYIVPIEGGDGGYRPDTISLSAEYLNVTNEGYVKHLLADDINAQEVDADEMTAEVAAFNTLTANAVNAGTVTANDIIAKEPIVDVRAFGAKGDGITDDTAAFQAAVATLVDNSKLLIPAGFTFYIKATNQNVIQRIDTHNHSLFLIEGKSNVTITGNGKIIFDSVAEWYSPTVQNAVYLFTFKDCQGCAVKNTHISGNVWFHSDKTEPLNKSSLEAVYFYHCDNSLMTDNIMTHLDGFFTVSGQAANRQDVSTNELTRRTIIANNIFDYFGKNSTFGAAATDLLIVNNVFHNCMCSVKLSQYGKLGEKEYENKSGKTIFSNNVITWDSDFELPILWWDTNYSQDLVGVMIQAANHHVIISNNIIDMSGYSGTLNPHTDSCCISVLKHTSDFTIYKPKNLQIKNNMLISSKQYGRSILIESSYYSLDVMGNSCDGDIIIVSNDVPSEKVDYYKIDGNTLTRTTVENKVPSVTIQKCNCESITISNNTFTKGQYTVYDDYSIIALNEIHVDKLIISDNDMAEGGIGTYNLAESNIGELYVKNNLLGRITLKNSGSTYVVTNNVFRNNTMAIELTINDSVNNAISIISENTFLGTQNNAQSGNYLKLNKGRLRFDNNSYNPKNPINAIQLGNDVFVVSGNLLGNGAPNINAQYGTTYIDYGTGQDACYLKTTVNGTSGWKKIATTS